MAVDGCLVLCTYALAVFNKVVLFIGGGLFGLGLWLRYGNSTKILFEIEVNSRPFMWGVRVMIGVGAVMALVATYGERAICKKDTKVLRRLAILLAILTIAEPVVGGIAYSKREEIAEFLMDFYTTVIRFYEVDENEQIGDVLKYIHSKLECCGLKDTTMHNTKKTCHKPGDKPCTEFISEFFGSAALTVFAILGTEVVLIAALVCTIILVKRIKIERERNPGCI